MGTGPRLMNDIGVPVCTVASNLHMPLSWIPEDVGRFSVLQLKDAFFCILLHTDSWFLFAFEDSYNQASQLAWTVLPHGFRDRWKAQLHSLEVKYLALLSKGT